MVPLYREIREKEDTHSSSIFLQIVKSYLCVKVMGDEMNVSIAPASRLFFKYVLSDADFYSAIFLCILLGLF